MLVRFRKAQEEREGGFTLIELLVVVIIIGILAAIAIPIFLNQRKSAVTAGVESDVRNVATNMETLATTNGGKYTSTNVNLGANPMVVGTGNNVYKSDGSTTITFSVATNGTDFWLCGTNTNSNATATSPVVYWASKGGLQSGLAACPDALA